MSIMSLPRRAETPTANGTSGGSVASTHVVPWAFVGVLAAAMAYADGFWLTVLRQSVGGQLPRVLDPFNSWWRESTVYLPVFVLAVLGALILGQRWFGGSTRPVRKATGTALLVVATGTVAGLLTTVGSSGYDYYIGVTRPGMRAMKAACDAACLSQRHHDLLITHIRGIIYISRWLLLSNLAAVAVVVAFFGARGLLSARTPSATAAGIVDGASRARDLRLLLAATLLGSAAIHAAVVPAHLTEWSLAGVFFLFLAIWQIGVAGLAVARVDDRVVLPATMAISALPLVLWLVSRTVGLPFGPDAGVAEGVRAPDLLSCVLELLTLVLAAVLLRSAGSLSRRRAASPPGRALLIAAVVAVTAIAIGSVGLSWFDVYTASGGGTTMSAH